jgi:cation diffusion facilitator CzcD-associated flavoprotein CzcO
MGEQQFDVIIVGAGFGGIGAAIQLSSLGYENIVILDREDDLGGTWHVNHYPGLSVDQPSPTFSYRFEPNPYWSRMYAPGAELKSYAVHVAEKYDVRRFMRFNTTVEGARWDEDAQVWRVALAGGETLSTQFLSRKSRTSPVSRRSAGASSTPPPGMTTSRSPAAGPR